MGIGVGVFGVVITCSNQIKLILAQYMHNNSVRESLIKVSPGKYALDYFHKDKKYTVILPIKKGPKRIRAVYGLPLHFSGEPINVVEREVYEELECMIGPNEDFHNNPLTPVDLGYRQLRFVFQWEHDLTFTQNETIKLI